MGIIMSENSSRMRHEIDMNSIGIFLFCLYIFISYLANDVLLPSVINTYVLYAFLGYSVLYVLVKKKLKINSTVKWLALFMAFSLLFYDLFTGETYIQWHILFFDC